MMLQRNQSGQRHQMVKTGVLLCSALFTCAIVYAQSMPLSQLEERLPADWNMLRQAAERVSALPPDKNEVASSEAATATSKTESQAAPRPQNSNKTFKAQDPVAVQQLPEATEQPEELVDKRIFTAVEEMPRPPMDNLQKYFAEYIHYPEEAKKKQIQGRVVLQFVIDKDGNVTNTVLQRDIGGGCGAEAMRVVRNMPKWKPGYQGGQPVNVYYTLPVSFKLENSSPADNTSTQY